MKYNTQTNRLWAYNIMTECHGGGRDWIDYIWRWGCIVTCLANIIQDIRGEKFTPKDMNDMIKDIRAYAYLDNPLVPESIASNILWKKLERYFPDSLEFRYNVRPINYERKDGYYYIARVRHDRTRAGHYINVVGVREGYFNCFDVENGEFRDYKIEDITFLHRIKKL